MARHFPGDENNRRETPRPVKLSDTDKKLVAVLAAAISSSVPKPEGQMPEESSSRMTRIVDEKADTLAAELRLDLIRNCQSCQAPGGAMNEAVKKLDTVLQTLNIQKGKRELIAITTPFMVVIVSVFLGGFVNYKFQQIKDLQAAYQAQTQARFTQVQYPKP